MSVFRDSLAFFDQVGLYDVILPFLLVFTLVYGVLEKSRIFGTEKGADGKTYSRKNLNAMVAFVTGFFVVASAQLVALINVFVARVALILIILVMFMILVASFHAPSENGFDLKDFGGKWLIWVVFIAVLLIFADGVGWLQPAWEYVTGYWDSQLMGTIFLFAIVVGFIMYVTKAPGKEEAKK
jgi:hypothetical protein